MGRCLVGLLFGTLQPLLLPRLPLCLLLLLLLLVSRQRPTAAAVAAFCDGLLLLLKLCWEFIAASTV